MGKERKTYIKNGVTYQVKKGVARHIIEAVEGAVESPEGHRLGHVTIRETGGKIGGRKRRYGTYRLPLTGQDPKDGHITIFARNIDRAAQELTQREAHRHQGKLTETTLTRAIGFNTTIHEAAHAGGELNEEKANQKATRTTLKRFGLWFSKK